MHSSAINFCTPRRKLKQKRKTYRCHLLGWDIKGPNSNPIRHMGFSEDFFLFCSGLHPKLDTLSLRYWLDVDVVAQNKSNHLPIMQTRQKSEWRERKIFFLRDACLFTFTQHSFATLLLASTFHSRILGYTNMFFLFFINFRPKLTQICTAAAIMASLTADSNCWGSHNGERHRLTQLSDLP